jgi:hypothetical protein
MIMLPFTTVLASSLLFLFLTTFSSHSAEATTPKKSQSTVTTPISSQSSESNGLNFFGQPVSHFVP